MRSTYLKKMMPLLALYLFFSVQPSFAQDKAADTSAITASRIALPLDTLLKQFKHNANSEAEIILRDTRIEVDEQYFSHATSYIAVYINSDEAVRDYSQISISFNSFYEDIALEFANVRTPEGQMDSIKADATQIQSPTDENFYHDRKELLFSLPNVRKGSVIEFQYRYTDTKKIIAGQWFDSFGLNWWEDRAANQGSRADPVAATSLTITAPKNVVLYSNDLSKDKQFAKLGISNTRSEKGNRQVLTWKAKNLPAIVLQEDMPRDQAQSAQVRVSTMGSWSQVSDWAGQLIAPHLLSDANLDTLIDGIAKKSATPEEKVKAVYQTLQQKVRYVFAHAGRGGYEPHNAFEVLANGYGDCKDQSTLAVAMLRKLGIKADPALLVTRSRGIPDMSITSVSFDHMIVHIPAQAGLQEIWMDTSGDTSLFPGFSLGLEGQPALIVNPATQSIVSIKSLPAEQHFAHLDITFDKYNSEKAQANFTVNFGGMFEQRLRSMWQYSRERDKSFREMMGHIYPSADITQLNGNNADSMWQGFAINGRFSAKNNPGSNSQRINYLVNINQFMSLFSDLRNLHKPQDRVQDFATETGYSLSTRFVFPRPGPEFVVTLNSQGQNFDNPYFSVTQKGREEKDTYIVEQNIIFKPFRTTAKDYAHYYQLVQQLLDSGDWSISYNYDKGAAELAALTLTAANSGKADNFISIARLHIKKGAYAQALSAAIQATKIEPGSGEAYYMLGLAQGYSNLLYDSEKSFAKAEELGFAL